MSSSVDPLTVSHPVLYVDDEEANLAIFEARLGKEFEVVTVTSAAEALEELRARKFDVLVTDHRMPGMTGIELCAHVAKLYPDIERLLLTGHTDHETAMEAINLGGVSRYLLKPWEYPVLREAIRDALETALRRRLVSRLQAEVEAAGRVRRVAAERGRVLRDLENVTNQVRMSCDELEVLLPDLRGPVEMSLAAFDRIHEEIADLRVAVDFLVSLHGRVRQLESGDSDVATTHYLANLLYSAATVARANMPPHGRLDIECDDAVQVLCSRADLGRILVNLLTNAARALGDPHAPAGERVCVRAYEEQGRIYVDVSDDGPGIPEALRGGLFERGAGLAESRRLAVANGGDLELLSGDGGSSFRLTLAVSRVGQAGAERPVVA